MNKSKKRYNRKIVSLLQSSAKTPKRIRRFMAKAVVTTPAEWMKLVLKSI